jgi:hypothetical protein
MNNYVRNLLSRFLYKKHLKCIYCDSFSRHERYFVTDGNFVIPYASYFLCDTHKTTLDLDIDNIIKLGIIYFKNYFKFKAIYGHVGSSIPTRISA